LLKEHDRIASAEILNLTLNQAKRRYVSDLESIEASKGRFRDRVLVDPDDPCLTPAQRRRALNPTLKDFIKLVKLERLILSDPVVASSKAESEHISMSESDEECRARWGLPPALDARFGANTGSKPSPATDAKRDGS